MKLKTLTVLLTIFLVQCITSCIGGMGPACDPDQYAVYYRSLELNPFTTQGTIDTDKETAVDPTDFGLNLSILFEMEELYIALNKETKAGFSFTPAVARSCANEEYVFYDPIIHIEILVNDVNLVVKSQDITDAFSVEHSSNTSIYNSQIAELYKDPELWHNDYIFTLTDPQAVSKTARFTIVVHKESGAKLTAQTPAITFKD